MEGSGNASGGRAGLSVKGAGGEWSKEEGRGGAFRWMDSYMESWILSSMKSGRTAIVCK